MNNPNSTIVLKIIWGALLASNLVYLFVVYFLASQGNQKFGENEMLFYVFVALAFSMCAFARKFFTTYFNNLDFAKIVSGIDIQNSMQYLKEPARSQVQSMNDDEKKIYFARQRLTVNAIISWAIAESAAVFGFAAFILGYLPEVNYMLLFSLSSMLTLFMLKPGIIEEKIKSSY